MNNIFYCIFLGIIQGLTEFIPVSSSAHLVIAQNMLGLKEPQVFFDVVLHVGTLFAVIAYFFKDIIEIIKSLFNVRSENFKLVILIVIGTIPAFLGGYFLKDFFENLFSLPIAVCLFLVITGVVLFMTKFVKKEQKNIKGFSYLDAFIIGVAQMCAIAPGLSRSGMTISTGIFRNINRELCAKYSLLLSIPAVMGALVFKLKDIRTGDINDIFNIILGFIFAFLVGYIAIKFLFKVLKEEKLYIFSYYCWIVGGLSSLYFLTK